ncbi:hypothetical protein QQZ08_007536 [Neonectria magnoliae]|uniref:DNA/RNA-binding domain-containing protein n=1 Tax=Neonectria magnoliae TaxID=2732573 RepID=A0ABR1HYB3_9HYPO
MRSRSEVRGAHLRNTQRSLWVEHDEPQSAQLQNAQCPLWTDQPPDEGPVSEMALQPETKPISQDQLVAEVKAIYAGLVMVEAKCIEVDKAQAHNAHDGQANTLNNEQWQALIALHRTLLNEHHDFFLASQHPSASAPLRRLTTKYAMPARMWKHGIHSFLELLRHRSPPSSEHMRTFIYLAYSMMALLFETVPTFEDTWIECLGDLPRYRMAIEDDDIRDREVWTGVSRHWYSKASDKSPTTGRLYHHLAILARPNALQQLYYYAKSLCVPVPFASARECIATLFDPVLPSTSTHRLPLVDAAFARVHGIFFSGQSENMLSDTMEEFSELLDHHNSRVTREWLDSGCFHSISLARSLLGYGAESNVPKRTMSQQPDETDISMDALLSPAKKFSQALSFATKTYETVIRRWGDSNVLPFAHTALVFIYHMTHFPDALPHLERTFLWKRTAILLNSLLKSTPEPRMDGDFPRPEKDDLLRPLPEDYDMRGLVYCDEYFPKRWFDNGTMDEDEKSFIDKTNEDEKVLELTSVADERKERIYTPMGPDGYVLRGLRADRGYPLT